MKSFRGSFDSAQDKRRGFIPLLALLIVTIVLALGGEVYVMQKHKKLPPQANVPVPQPAPAATSTDETANWKTYRNEKYGFEVKYPTDWAIEAIRKDAKNYYDLIYITKDSAFVEIAPAEAEGFGGPEDADLKNINIGNEEVAFLYWNAVDKNIYIVATPVFDIFPTGWAKDNRFFARAPDIQTLDVVKKILSTFKFIEPSAPLGQCVRAGCSSQLCVDEKDKGIVTTCEYREEYGCYQTAVCERQSSGQCGFTPTAALSACLEKAK